MAGLKARSPGYTSSFIWLSIHQLTEVHRDGDASSLSTGVIDDSGSQRQGRAGHRCVDRVGATAAGSFAVRAKVVVHYNASCDAAEGVAAAIKKAGGAVTLARGDVTVGRM